MDPRKDPEQGTTFRGALRGIFRAALERLSADGVVGITAEELPVLVDQVRETADPKFGDYSGTMAMALAKRAGTLSLSWVVAAGLVGVLVATLALAAALMAAHIVAP